MIRPRSLCLSMFLVLGLLAPATFGSDISRDTKPATLESQLDYLTSALADSLKTMDWTQIGTIVDGFKAAGISGKDLEITVLRATCEALESGNFDQHGTIIVFGTATLARAGDTKALETLRKWGYEDSPVAPPVLDYTLAKTNPAEFLKNKKIIASYEQRTQRQAWSFLALTLLHEPNIQDKIIAGLLKNPVKDYRPFLYALLWPNCKAGLETLLSFCADEKGSFMTQGKLLSRLISTIEMAAGPNVDESLQFTLLGEIGKELRPLRSTVLPRFGKTFMTMLKRWNPGTGSKPWDETFNTITSMGLPKGALTKEDVVVLTALKPTITGGPLPNSGPARIDWILKEQGFDSKNTAVKPPEPPKDF